MKLLIAGAWEYEFYEPACAEAFERLGVEVVAFSWRRYFKSLLGRVDEKYTLPGITTWSLNKALLARATEAQPDAVLVWRGTRVLPETLRAIRERTGALLVCYNNDDPFSPLYQQARSMHLKRLWHYFRAAIPEYDLHFVYRQQNIAEFRQAGAKQVELLRSYYIPALHRPVALSAEEKQRYESDVVFVGHYEPSRLDYLRTLAQAGVKVRVFGCPRSWTPERVREIGADVEPARFVREEEYPKVLCAAKMCLCFFSRLNRDTYTRRVFEIPACRRLLLCERTAEMLTLYREDEEAVYFSSPEELTAKATSLLAQPERVNAIAAAGRARCLKDGYSVDARMAGALERIARLRGQLADSAREMTSLFASDTVG